MQRKEERPAEREKARHGDILLPVNSYHCLVPGTYRELALHWHEEMEITLIREGNSNYRIGQSDFLAEEGDILLIPPFCTHSASEIPGRTMVSDSLVFHLDLLGAKEQDLSASKYLRPLAEGQLQLPEVIRRGEEGYEEIREVFLGLHPAMCGSRRRAAACTRTGSSSRQCCSIFRNTAARRSGWRSSLT